MKTLFIISFLVLLTSCGSGGNGGGGSSSTPVPEDIGNPAPDYNAFLAKTLYDFHLVVESCDGAGFTAIAYTDQTWPEENRNDWNGLIDMTGTTNIVVTGRELNWQVTKDSGNCPNMVMKLYRQFGAGLPALIESKVIVNDGDDETITYML